MSDTEIDFSYPARLVRLREAKLRHTRDKMACNGYMDHDDHGRVPLPAGFEWKPVPTHPNGGFYGLRAWGENFRSLMEAYPVYVDSDDALAGRWMLHLWGFLPGGFNPAYDYSELVPEQRLYGIVTGIGAPHHFGPDLPMGMALGWGGLLDKVRACRGRHGPEKKDFYDAVENVVRGVQSLIRRTAANARERAAAEGAPQIRRNLEEIAAISAWLADGPPRTFREACQWLAWWAVVSRSYNGDGAGGQLDEILRPFYERETAAGTLTDEDAIFCIACLLINDTKYYQLGGPGPDGRDLVSPVSYLIVEAAHRVSIACNLTVRVHDAMDRKFFLTTVRHLFEDRQGWPRYAGDRGLVEGFMKNGFPVEMARRRIAVGCHWMSLEGREYTLNDCVKINVAKVFDVALQEMLAGDGSPGTEALWALFDKHLRRAVLCTAKGMDFQLAHQEDSAPELMLDLFCHGPLEKGLDASHGGVEFYNLCVDGSALATVADSFAALEQRIERDGALTWPQIAACLRDNYAGASGEQIRLMMKTAPRYGHGDSLGDDWALRVSQWFTQLVKERPTPGGRNMIPGWFSWSNTIPMGRELRATPNGRRAGEPISHGANPNPGFRRDGAPTAMVLAIAAIQPGYGNTAPIQMEIDPGVSKGAGGIERIASLITTHFDRGGTLFNINVIDRARLLAAHRNPAAFPDLVVRVTGFSAFFSTLSPEFRQLVVDRILAED